MKHTPHEEMLLGNSLYNAQDAPVVKVVYLSRKRSLPSETVRTASRYSGINSRYTTPPSFPSRIKSTPESKSRSIVQEQWHTNKYARWHILITSIQIFSTRTTNMSTQLCSCNYLTITKHQWCREDKYLCCISSWEDLNEEHRNKVVKNMHLKQANPQSTRLYLYM